MIKNTDKWHKKARKSILGIETYKLKDQQEMTCFYLVSESCDDKIAGVIANVNPPKNRQFLTAIFKSVLMRLQEAKCQKSVKEFCRNEKVPIWCFIEKEPTMTPNVSKNDQGQKGLKVEKMQAKGNQSIMIFMPKLEKIINNPKLKRELWLYFYCLLSENRHAL